MTDIEYLKKYYKGNIDDAIKLLNKNIPVQYIVGEVDFYGNIFKINNNVLIPRFETEQLVELTIEYINDKFNRNVNILDIGTGSGCIPIALKKLFPKADISAVDISKEALVIAQENARINNTPINFYESDIFSNVKEKFDCIISNPPYLTEKDFIMDIVKNNEPAIALYGEDNGLYFYKEILKKGKKYLKDKFIIAFEIEKKKKKEILNIAKNYYPSATIIAAKDLRKLDRFIFIIQK